jgi:hypothetical protein
MCDSIIGSVRCNLLSLLAALLVQTVGAGAADAATLWVSPDGRAGAPGSADAPLPSLAEAAGRAQPGDVIKIAGGTYAGAQPIRLGASGTADALIRIEPADATRPLFDFSAQRFEQRASGIVVQGDYWHVIGVEVIGSAHNGIQVTGHHNIIERCITHENQDSGIQLNAPASENLVLNCDSYRNVDRPTHGENADGFAAKFEIGPGNIFRGCRAWENADDGFDLWKAPVPVRIESCVAFRNGINLWGIEGFTGNGNGFKLGGDFIPAAHMVTGCVATDQPARGFDQNNNMSGLTVEQCTAIRCKSGFSFTRTPSTGQPHVLRGNLAWDAPAMLVEGTVQERNQWFHADGSPAPARIGKPTPPGTPKSTRRRPATP